MLSVFNVVIILEKNLKNKISFKSSSTRLPMMMSYIHQQVEMSRWVPKKFLPLEIQQLDHDENIHGNWLIFVFLLSKIDNE